MQTVLTPDSGTHTLRPLLADDKHRPYFVHSKLMQVTVTRKNASVDPATLGTKAISRPNLAGDARGKRPFGVQFHASGLNVVYLSQKQKEAGHFRLTVSPQGRSKPVELKSIQGQAEVWPAPPAGACLFKLDFMNNASTGNTLASTVSAAVSVE